ncbi:hypothetical protein DFR30_1777 [Thiogranum longum]|uniref:Uncharacterized protein n=1 Tax=Thiogranum longum TaxID=1537524 RepID=A0A4R1HGN4_9GAMM|nr:hypothetical protein [Thiogranum longum]TCK18499.1 hypothetical protein DFR30_1777 [Thiogranum longum]
MILKLTIDDQTFNIEVPEQMLKEAEEFYAKMDADMDRGWQMSRFWVEKPDLYQRCQIVADRVLGAFHTENKKMVSLMSGYILSRVPHVEEVIVDTTGDITLTEIIA